MSLTTGIEDDYVSKETAKLLKEHNFNGWSDWAYTGTNDTYKPPFINTEFTLDTEKDYFVIPTISLALKWIRENYNILFEIRMTNRTLTNSVKVLKYYWVAVDMKTCTWLSESTIFNVKAFDSYKEAEEDAIKHCLKDLIKK